MVKKKGDNPLAGLTRFNVDPNPVTPATLRRNILVTQRMKDISKNIERSQRSINNVQNRKHGWDTDEESINWNKENIAENKEWLEETKSHQKNLMEGKVTPMEFGYGYGSTNWMLYSVLNGEKYERNYGAQNITGIEKNYPADIRRNPGFHFNYGPQQYKDEARKATKYQYADAKQSWSHGSYEKQNKMPKHVAELNAAEPWRNRKPEEYGSPDTTGEYKEWVKTQYDTAAHGAPKVTVADIFTRGYKPTEGFKLKNPVGEPATPVKEHMASPQFAQHEQLSFDFSKPEQLSLF